MAKLSEQAIDKINNQVDFSQLFRMSELLLGVRSFLTQEVAEKLDRLAKRFNEVSEGGDYDEDDSVFDLAEDLECEIEEAQDRLEAIYDALSSITGCRPDEDEEWNEE